MSNKYMDFDKFFKETKKVSEITIHVYEKDYKLPSSIPAMMMLEIYRAYKEGRFEVDEAQQMEMAFALLSEENVAEWCAKGMTMDELAEIMKWAMEQMQEVQAMDAKKSSNRATRRKKQ